MWDFIKDTQKRPQTVRTLAWMDKVTANELYVRQARDSVYQIESKVSEITLFRNVPQSAPWHAEGITLMHHIERMLVGLFALTDQNFSLFSLEEFAVEKHLKSEIEELHEVIGENVATLSAFIFLHDIAKQDVISFDSPPGSPGASAGFVKNSKIKPEILAQHYLKLARAFQAEQKEISDSELPAVFYEKNQISVHYYDHPQVAVSEKYESARETVADIFRLTGRDREILRLLIRYHMDAIIFFKHKADATKYALMASRATKAGIDADDYLDIQLASLFLDTAIGTRVYKEGKWQSDFTSVLNMLKSEELALPHRKERRLNLLLLKQQQAFKEILKKTKLDSETIFEELDIPFGPSRAKVISELHDLIKSPEAEIDTSKYSAQMIKKIEQARGLYATRQA